MQYLRSLWNGELALWKSFWIFGVTVLLALTYFSNIFLAEALRSSPGAGGLFIGIYGITVVGYTVLAYVGIWRSAGNYDGIKLWAYAARLWIIVNMAGLLFTIYHVSTTDTNDPGKTSGNIKDYLVPDEKHPFIGFWKSDCMNDFGLAIDKTEQDLYSVSFCGPGGCFKPGTYRPNTNLVDDDSYQIVDSDTIEVEGSDGFSTYYRCE